MNCLVEKGISLPPCAPVYNKFSGGSRHRCPRGSGAPASKREKDRKNGKQGRNKGKKEKVGKGREKPLPTKKESG